MRILVAFWLLALPIAAQDLARQLDEVARVGTVMVDGDLCRRIVTERAAKLMTANDPRDPWAAGDNYDVNHEPYIAVKKTLIRLSRLAGVPCDVNLWMPVPSEPSKVHVVIRNVHEISQFWTWGAMLQPYPPEMKQVLETGKRITVTRRPGLVSVLAPVYDSLGDAVGILEAVGQAKPDPYGNVK